MKQTDKFNVTISTDNQKAFVELQIPGIDLTEEEVDQIIDSIKSKGIKQGFQENKVRKDITTATGLSKISIAKGYTPQNGDDGYIKHLIAEKKDNKPVLLEDGNVDFYNLNLITSIKKDTPIAEIIPPTDGEYGYNVFGEKVAPKPGQPSKVPAGKNIYVDKNIVYSEIDGQLSVDESTIEVNETLEIDGDVDFSSGNIDFIGTVVIKGSIRDGFKVKARGDVKVGGQVDSSTVVCGGNLTVKGGIQGRNKGVIEAEGSVVARFIENSKVLAQQVIAQDAIMHSDILAREKVLVLERKGLLVGGTIRAGKQISAKSIGSNLATKTYLEVGVDPQLRKKQQKLTEELSEKKLSAKKAQQGIKLLNSKGKNNQLNSSQQQMLNKFHATLNFLKREIEEMTEQHNLAQAKLKSSKGVVEATQRVYPGVKVTIGSKSRVISDITSSSTFYIGHDGEVSVK